MLPVLMKNGSYGKMDNEIKDIDVLMVQYLQNTCTEQNRKRFLSWLYDKDENETSFYQMKEIFDVRQRIDNEEHTQML